MLGLSALCVIVLVGTLGTAYGEVCAGCPLNKDPDDPHVRNFLTRAVSVQNSKSNDEAITILSIEKVTSQIVAGTKYTYHFRGEGQKTKKPYTCHSVLLVQAWISPEPQVLEYKCSTKKAKRDVGEIKDINPENTEEVEYVNSLAAKGIETLDELDPDDNKRVIVDVYNGKKQLVNGIMYHVAVKVKTTSCSENGPVNEKCLSEEIGPHKVCFLQIYRSFADDSPNNAKVVKSECETVTKERNLITRESKESVESKASRYGTKMINNVLNSINVKGLVKVLGVDTTYNSDARQMSLTLELGDTNCTKQHNLENSECTLIPDAQNHMVCTVDIIHDEKSKKMRIHSSGMFSGVDCKTTKKSASSSRNIRAIGAERPLESLTTKHRDELRAFVSSSLTTLLDSKYQKKVTSLISGSFHVTSGMVERLLVEVADTNCAKGEESNENDCILQEQPRLICRLEIWEKLWIKAREVIHHECSPIMPTSELLGVDENDENLIKFKKFTTQFNKAYPNVKELNTRFRIFRANMKKVDYLQKTEQGSGIYGATMFADLTSQEFKKNFLGLKKRDVSEPQFPIRQAEIPDITLPDEYDWRSYNIVTPVKNQGMCGSCWAFSVTGNIEGQYALKTGNLVSLSEQELVDCDKYDSGCNGGLFDTAYHAIEEMGGLETESDYPYSGHDGKCKFDSSEVKVSISSSVNISSNETDMAKWLVANGPISIALNANAMQFYFGGVSHPLKFLCSPKDLDHGVLIVGYGIHKTLILHRHLPYWLIKNSWGPHWGHSGYYMLYRGDGSCGVNQMASSAVL